MRLAAWLPQRSRLRETASAAFVTLTKPNVGPSIHNMLYNTLLCSAGLAAAADKRSWRLGARRGAAALCEAAAAWQLGDCAGGWAVTACRGLNRCVLNPDIYNQHAFDQTVVTSSCVAAGRLRWQKACHFTWRVLQVRSKFGFHIL